ncbi:MAG: cytochrome c [Anaerolineales bacterium]|nr:cytochrome c [Anaerolineales bacterium]
MKKMVYLLAIISLITVLSLTACGGGSERLSQSGENNTGVVQAAEAPATVGDSAAGQKLFASTCSACHGPAGEGLPGLGKDMTTSEFIAGKSDDELVAFIKVGRDPSDPLNTTGVAMPPKGGNPALSEEDLYHLVAYMRTIHKQ